MGGIIALLLITIPPYVVSDIWDITAEHRAKRNFQRRMMACRGRRCRG